MRVIDLGVARIPDLEEFPSNENPGTPSYMAPELFEGAQGSETTDLYALGVTVYRMFARHYPYGEIEPLQRPKQRRYTALTQLRPDLPAWLDAAVARAVSERAANRQGDVLEFAYELESGASWTTQPVPRMPLYSRNPVLVWQILSVLLVIACVVLIARR